MRRAALKTGYIPHRFATADFAGTASEYLGQYKPALPVNFLDYDGLAQTAREFVELFPGTVAYAAKVNPTPRALDALHHGGVKSFEVASLPEIQQIKSQFPNAKMFFMHPVKSPEAIRAAYHDYGVRAFVVDCRAELYRIMKETRLATDLELFVRLKLPKNPSAGIDFSSKFGASPTKAATLLKLCRPVSRKLGIAFHVGTQTEDPNAYDHAIRIAAKVSEKSDVTVEVLDVGGGFPSRYPGPKLPSLAEYIAVIKRSIKTHGLSHMDLMCEPGRALVSRNGALAARVERRKGRFLYLNDGTYGGLFDAGSMRVQLKLDATLVKKTRSVGKTNQTTEFTLFGPTCDSIDRLYHTYELPDDVAEGDYIVFGSMGSYCATMRTNFNGFGASDTVWCKDVQA